MGWRAIVETDAQLAAAIGVSGAAVCKARQRGRIEPRADGCWDVLAAVMAWRGSTLSTLQRPAGTFRPWLSSDVNLSGTIVNELMRRAKAAGARIVWDDDDDEDDEDDQAKA